ncbi:uncharacterized protein L199_001390 [Kwoniella botswanensis]|uniref:uncharacterized protein n=1 Tax=Kwoniella botswanensis TaxID=1268659 RepID=UPI00315D62D9
MPLNTSSNIQPNDPRAFKHPSIRKRWIQNLIDLLHFSLLKGDIERAKRAWSILVRCREVNWKSRWYWGLLILSSSSSSTSNDGYESQSQGREVERWLNGLRVSAREEDKPSLLHALVLHLIKSGQYRHAYDQLETYLSSYPFLLSGPLHTYAGLLSFYLAQPPSLRLDGQSLPISSSFHDKQALRQHLSAEVELERSSRSSLSSSPPLRPIDHDHLPADAAGLRTARGWFVKALEIDKTDQVSRQFIDLIDNPDKKGINDDDESDEEELHRIEDSDQSMEDPQSVSDTENEVEESDSEYGSIEEGLSERDILDKEEGSDQDD